MLPVQISTSSDAVDQHLFQNAPWPPEKCWPLLAVLLSQRVLGNFDGFGHPLEYDNHVCGLIRGLDCTGQTHESLMPI